MQLWIGLISRHVTRTMAVQLSLISAGRKPTTCSHLLWSCRYLHLYFIPGLAFCYMFQDFCFRRCQRAGKKVKSVSKWKWTVVSQWPCLWHKTVWHVSAVHLREVSSQFHCDSQHDIWVKIGTWEVDFLSRINSFFTVRYWVLTLMHIDRKKSFLRLFSTSVNSQI